MKPTTVPTKADRSGLWSLRIGSWFGQHHLLIVAAIGGLVMGLTPVPVGMYGLAWVAIAPLWWVVYQRSRQSTSMGSNLRQAAALGLAWGVGYHGLALAWITGVHPMTWMGVPWLASITIALVCWLIITLWGAGITVVWAIAQTLVLRWLQPRPWLSVLWGVVFWCAIEWIWSRGALYWSAIAYSQSPYNLPLLHLGQISGPWTITAVLVGVNGALAYAVIAWRSPQTRPAARTYGLGAIALLVSAHLIGGGLYIQPLQDAPDAALKVGIIQGNIPNTIKLYDEGWRRAIEGYTTGYETLSEQGVDVVLTPETALPTVWTSPLHTRTSLYQSVVQQQTPIWLGAFGGEGGDIANSLFTVLGDGRTYSEYRKARLVPLGEYIPFERWLGSIINRLSPLDARMIAGDLRPRFDTPWGLMTVGICYESAFPQHFQQQTAQGGQLILTASNNAHYAASMPTQHHAQDVMRAIESDRWAVRATNTGYSGIVDAHGHTLWMSGINTYELHAHTVYRRQTRTLYVRWGNWLTPALGLGAIALSLWELRNRKRSPLRS